MFASPTSLSFQNPQFLSLFKFWWHNKIVYKHVNPKPCCFWPRCMLLTLVLSLYLYPPPLSLSFSYLLCFFTQYPSLFPSIRSLSLCLSPPLSVFVSPSPSRSLSPNLFTPITTTKATTATTINFDITIPTPQYGDGDDNDIIYYSYYFHYYYYYNY